MRLYLCRHGHAGESRKGDFYRELNHHGHREVTDIASRPLIYACQADLILSSPALRALQTAELIAASLGYKKEKIITDQCIYEQDVDAIVSLIATAGHGFNSVWLFGHNPSLAWLAAYFTAMPETGNPPGTVTALEFAADAWTDILQTLGAGRLLFREKP